MRHECPTHALGDDPLELVVVVDDAGQVGEDIEQVAVGLDRSAAEGAQQAAVDGFLAAGAGGVAEPFGMLGEVVADPGPGGLEDAAQEVRLIDGNREGDGLAGARRFPARGANRGWLTS